MDNFVVDTNVLVVANGNSGTVDENDVLECIGFVESIYAKSVVCVDDHGFIFYEYFRNLSHSRKPGIGGMFAKWLRDNQFNAKHCERVNVVPIDEHGTEFDGFSFDEDLEKFDKSDRKFVVVALRSKTSPEVCNACDSDWWIYRDALKRMGVSIRFVCSNQLRSWNAAK